MPGKPICRETIKKNTIADMRKLGIYKAEYLPIIDIYCEMREQYERLTAEYRKSGYKYDEETSEGGSKKAPIVATLESLRRDILQYADRLCLNPKVFLKDVPVKKKKSALAEALSNLES